MLEIIHTMGIIPWGALALLSFMFKELKYKAIVVWTGGIGLVVQVMCAIIYMALKP